jgi:hypothetical protein
LVVTTPAADLVATGPADLTVAALDVPSPTTTGAADDITTTKLDLGVTHSGLVQGEAYPLGQISAEGPLALTMPHRASSWALYDTAQQAVAAISALESEIEEAHVFLEQHRNYLDELKRRRDALGAAKR